MSESQKWFILTAIAGFALLLYLLAPVFVPFLAAATLAYLGNPLVQRLQRLRLPRSLAAVVVFAVLFATVTLAFVLAVPVIEKQISVLIGEFPAYAEKLRKDVINPLLVRLGFADVQIDSKTMQQALMEHWKGAGKSLANLFGIISSSGAAVIQFLANLVLIPVITFYLLRDWDKLLDRLQALVPRDKAKTVSRLFRESDQVLGSFLRGQFLVMLGLGLIYSVGLSLLDLKLAFLIGMTAGLLSFVPYLGFIVGLLIASIVMLTHNPDYTQLGWVALVFGVGQVIESVLLTPWLVGDRIGLHPVAVIFAVLAGGQLFGFVGVLLALPVAAVTVVWLRHAHEQYLQSKVYDSAN